MSNQTASNQTPVNSEVNSPINKFRSPTTLSQLQGQYFRKGLLIFIILLTLLAAIRVPYVGEFFDAIFFAGPWGWTRFVAYIIVVATLGTLVVSKDFFNSIFKLKHFFIAIFALTALSALVSAAFQIYEAPQTVWVNDPFYVYTQSFMQQWRTSIFPNSQPWSETIFLLEWKGGIVGSALFGLLSYTSVYGGLIIAFLLTVFVCAFLFVDNPLIIFVIMHKRVVNSRIRRSQNRAAKLSKSTDEMRIIDSYIERTDNDQFLNNDRHLRIDNTNEDNSVKTIKNESSFARYNPQDDWPGPPPVSLQPTNVSSQTHYVPPSTMKPKMTEPLWAGNFDNGSVSIENKSKLVFERESQTSNPFPVTRVINAQNLVAPNPKPVNLPPLESVSEQSNFSKNYSNMSASRTEKINPLPTVDLADEPLKITDLGIYPHNHEFNLPPLDLLSDFDNTEIDNLNRLATLHKSETIIGVLKTHGIDAHVAYTAIGNRVSKVEIAIAEGTRVAEVMRLENDLRLKLSAKQIRMEAPVPGKPYIGIEVPNERTGYISFKSLMNKLPPHSPELTWPIGVNTYNELITLNIKDAPHVLIAGSTGSGKSVAISALISALILRNTPNELGLILIDPKRVELQIFENIPHLIVPVIKDSASAVIVLDQLVTLMNERYEEFSRVKVRNISSYNEMFANSGRQMQQIIVVVDELSDLMANNRKEIETSVQRLTQLSRASGIHIILATQRPSVDVITGVIKANVPTRIAFSVSSQIDSRTIIDETGGERLLGKGDMLFKGPNETIIQRVQSCYLQDHEILAIVKYWVDQTKPKYMKRLTSALTSPLEGAK